MALVVARVGFQDPGGTTVVVVSTVVVVGEGSSTNSG